MSSRSVALTVAVLFLTLSLLGVKPTRAAATVLGVVAVQGTDNGVYGMTVTNTGPYTWTWLGGSTLSSPALCSDGYGSGAAELVVQGTDHHIYHKGYSSGTWSSSWDLVGPDGATNLQPVCVVQDGTLYVVVVGTDKALYWNSETVGSGNWAGWQSLGGATPSVPALVATDTPSTPGRLDLLVRGTDNGIYHKAYTSGSWASSWDRAGSGTTPDTPAGALVAIYIYPAEEWDTSLNVVVRGTDNGIYLNQLTFGCASSMGYICLTGWNAQWTSLGGSMQGAPELTGVNWNSGSGSEDSSVSDVVVWGTDGAIYWTSGTAYCGPSEPCVSGPWPLSWNAWDSLGGRTIATPASWGLGDVVTGSDHGIYMNYWYTGPTASGWTGWIPLGGASNSGPTVAGVTVCPCSPP